MKKPTPFFRFVRAVAFWNITNRPACSAPLTLYFRLMAVEVWRTFPGAGTGGPQELSDAVSAYLMGADIGFLSWREDE